MDGANLSGDNGRRETSENTVALVKLISEIGPDIAEISRRLGQFKESVRYRYNARIVDRGFQIKADLDYGALGLTRLVMKLKVSRGYSSVAKELFTAMSDLCYIVAYAGTATSDVYVVHGGVPTELVPEFRALMETMKDSRVFDYVEFFECNWFRVAPMRAELFDFEEGVWDFDWTNPPNIDDKAARATIPEKKKFDKVDLLILKELWKDSARSLKEIQEAIKKVNGVEINYKTLCWHYKSHVTRNGLVRDYSIAWHGLKHNGPREKVEGMGKYSYLGLSVVVRGTSEQEKMILRSQLNRLPFLWSEAAGEAYYCQMFVPLGMANDAFAYLKNLLRPFDERAEIFVLDKTQMESFTICYGLWDDRTKSWGFDSRSVLPRIEAAVLKVREKYQVR